MFQAGTHLPWSPLLGNPDRPAVFQQGSKMLPLGIVMLCGHQSLSRASEPNIRIKNPSNNSEKESTYSLTESDPTPIPNHCPNHLNQSPGLESAKREIGNGEDSNSPTTSKTPSIRPSTTGADRIGFLMPSPFDIPTACEIF